MAVAASPEAFCVTCGNVGRLKKDGTMHAHTRQNPLAGRKYSSGPLRVRCPGSGQPPLILMVCSHCERCNEVKRLEGEESGVDRMCGACGAFGALRRIGVTMPQIAAELERRFAARARSGSPFRGSRRG